MPPPSERELKRYCIRLWVSDYEKLKRVSQSSEAGINNLVRTIVHSYVTQLEALERSKIDAIPAVDLSGLDLTITLDGLEMGFDEAAEGN